MADQEKADQIGKNGYSEIEEKYQLDSRMQKIEDLYESLLISNC